MKSDPFKALELAVAPDNDALMIGGDAWPNAVDRRNPKLPEWPDASRRFATVAVRLPKARDELAMLLHAAAAMLKPDGALYLFGANDEGIGSAAKPLHALFGNVETAAIKHHARVFQAHGVRTDIVVHGALADWRRTFTFEAGGKTFSHVTFPGVFAKDRLDAGTALLLEHLPPLRGKVLDFGAGSGAISQVIRARNPDVAITMVDIDAIALESARENVPGARTVRSLGDLIGETFEAIVSNPPVHRGVAQDFSVLRDLVEARRTTLARDGAMFLVLQAKVPLAEMAPNAKRITSDRGHAIWTLQP